jgi:hypothetical protein
MEGVILGIFLFLAVIANIIGAVSASNKESNVTLYGLSLATVIFISILIGCELAHKEPIEQYQTKQEWKPRLQINQVGDKQDTIYIYNLKDTVK